jgi:hypothetical protein
MLLEIAESDAVGIALACAAEATMMARELYAEHTGAVLALRASRQLDLAERNRRDFGV